MSRNETQSAKLCLMAGEGELPLRVAENAKATQRDFVVYAMDRGNMAGFKKWVTPSQIRFIRPGLLNRNFRMMHEDGIEELVFAGKINKWMLLKSPLLDGRALHLLREQRGFNDDALMLSIIREVEKEGIRVGRQTDYLQDFFLKPGTYTQRQPTNEEEKDITFGFGLAKEMGRLDVGQTVVVYNQMVLSIEAIEGTDEAILRAGKWKDRQGGVVAKVEKPKQDLRFDVPTVGPRTLKAMKKAGLTVLAIEAGKTFVLERDQMIHLANRWGMSLVAV